MTNNTIKKRGRPLKILKNTIENEENNIENEENNEEVINSIDENFYKKDDSSLGIFNHAKKVVGLGSYFNSEKVIIVGGSGAGKSTLCSNIMVYICKKYSHVVLVTGSSDDESYFLIQKLCENNNIHFSIINANGDDKNNIITPILKNCLLIFDDLQKSHGGESMALKTLITNAFIRGRHDRLSTIWCCHSLKYIPDLVKNSCNMLFVDREYSQIPLTNGIQTKNKWYMLNSFLNPSFCKIVEFKPLTIQEINKRLQSKIWKEDRGKYADLKVKYGVMMAGNNSKELKKEIIDEQKEIKDNKTSCKDDDDELYRMAMERNYY